MNICITSSLLHGNVNVPSSKSYAHRMLICAALSNGVSVIKNVTMSKDIEATINSLKAVGAEFSIENSDITVKGISAIPENATINCCESGSTLRFMIPVAAALGIDAEFIGQGRLPQRPIDTYIREFSNKNIIFNYNNTMPFSISGKLSGGNFFLEGDISSQFVTGLLFALPLLENDSKIILTSKLESEPYVNMTIEVLRHFGINITKLSDGYEVKGHQKYNPANLKVEGDYSQAAFYYVANAIGNNINIDNLNPLSMQGDRKILDIIKNMCYNNGNECMLGHFNEDCSDIPDLVPILAVLGSFGNDESFIYNAKRLRIKESDRLSAISETLNKLGGKIKVNNDGLIIEPIISFNGGVVDSFSDHRIVMCAAIAATRTKNDVIIKNAQAVEKSYPLFFNDYNNLGGKANVITME